jgi:hypothetical protein
MTSVARGSISLDILNIIQQIAAVYGQQSFKPFSILNA